MRRHIIKIRIDLDRLNHREGRHRRKKCHRTRREDACCLFIYHYNASLSVKAFCDFPPKGYSYIASSSLVIAREKSLNRVPDRNEYIRNSLPEGGAGCIDLGIERLRFLRTLDLIGAAHDGNIGRLLIL